MMFPLPTFTIGMVFRGRNTIFQNLFSSVVCAMKSLEFSSDLVSPDAADLSKFSEANVKKKLKHSFPSAVEFCTVSVRTDKFQLVSWRFTLFFFFLHNLFLHVYNTDS